MLQTLLLVFHILCGLTLIALILIQQGRGATTGAAFGSGASSTVFGARGSATFLSRATAIIATIFFSICIVLAYLSTQTVAPKGLVERAAPSAPTAPGDVPSLPAQLPAAPAQPAAPAAQQPADMPSIPADQQPAAPEKQTKQ